MGAAAELLPASPAGPPPDAAADPDSGDTRSHAARSNFSAWTVSRCVEAPPPLLRGTRHEQAVRRPPTRKQNGLRTPDTGTPDTGTYPGETREGRGTTRSMVSTRPPASWDCVGATVSAAHASFAARCMSDRDCSLRSPRPAAACATRVMRPPGYTSSPLGPHPTRKLRPMNTPKSCRVLVHDRGADVGSAAWSTSISAGARAGGAALPPPTPVASPAGGAMDLASAFTSTPGGKKLLRPAPALPPPPRAAGSGCSA